MVAARTVMLFVAHSSTTRNPVTMESICQLYSEIHEPSFVNNIINDRRWSLHFSVDNPIACQNTNTGSSSREASDTSEDCIMYRLHMAIYDLKAEQNFRSSHSLKIKKFLFSYALWLTADYQTVADQCNIDSQKRLPVDSPELYDEITQTLGLIEKSGKYRSPTIEQCKDLIDIEFELVDLRNSWDLGGLCVLTFGGSGPPCKYYIIHKFAPVVSKRKLAFQATISSCKALRFAFVASSHQHIYDMFPTLAIIKSEKSVEVIKETFNALSNKVINKGCQDAEFLNYGQALLILEPSKWYEERKIFEGGFKLFCNAMDVVMRVGEYVSKLKSNKKIVNGRMDYKPYLTITAITGNVNEKFKKLSDYFKKTAAFNSVKASHDLSFINGRIAKFKRLIPYVSQRVGASLGWILDTAFHSAVGNLISEGAKVALAFAEACNPFKAIFGGTTATDMAAALTDFFKANGQLKQSQKLCQTLETLQQNVATVQQGLFKNQDMLNKAYEIVTQSSSLQGEDLEGAKITFLQKYGEYNPDINNYQIDSVGKEFDTIVDEGCKIIGDTNNLHDNIQTPGYEMIYEWFTTVPPDPCIFTKWEITQMVGLFRDLYEFQNELMETCATYIRSKIAEENAKMITSDSEIRSSDSDVFTREELINIAEIYQTTEHCTIIQDYCTVVQYRDGGNRPFQCDANKPNIPGLLGIVPRPKQEEEQEINIPDVVRGKNPEQSVDIERLMSGEKLTFQIPNFDWLKVHGNVLESERYQDIFVKNVMVFAPFVTNGETPVVKSTVTAVGSFNLQGDTRSYVFSVPFSSTYKYKEGTGTSCKNGIINKYTICGSNPLPEYCPLTTFGNEECNDDKGTLFPSIYGKWEIQLEGYHNTLKRQKVPVAKTPRSLKLVFILCKFQGDKKKKKQQKRKAQRQKITKRSNDKCCLSGEYWDEDKGQCERCPTGSQQYLNGYYCGVESPVRNPSGKVKAHRTGKNNTTSV